MSETRIVGFRVRGKCTALKPFERNLYESTEEAFRVIQRHRCKGSNARARILAELDNGEHLQVDYGYDVDISKYRFELLSGDGGVIAEDPTIEDSFTKDELGW